MKSRFLLTVLAGCCVVSGIGLATARAQSYNAPPAAAASDQSADMQAIRIRLAQQDEELRQLHERLGLLQNDVKALPPVAPPASLPTSALASPQVSPLISPDLTPLPATSGVIPATATSSPSVFELQDRMTSLEKRLDEQAARQNSPAAGGNTGYVVGSDMNNMTGNWAKGLQIQSANKDFRLHIGGVLQFDSNFFDNPDGIQAPASAGGIGPQPDSLDFRRIRLRMDGTFYEVFDFFMQVDFANTVTPAGSANPQSPATTSPAFDEMYINWGHLPIVGNFRAGNIKEPMGFEHMMTDSQLPFMERSYLQDFVFGPFNGGYSPGIELLNWRQDEMGTWAIGGFGADDDQFGFSLGNDYAGTGRVTWLPYYDEPSGGSYLVHLGMAGSIRSSDEGFVRLRTRGDVRSGPPGFLNPIYLDTNFTGKINALDQDIACGEFVCVLGSFSAVAEYAGTWIQDASINGVSHGTPFFQGGYVQCAYLLTGEHEIYDRHRGTFERIVPNENAFWVRNSDGGTCCGWGAWQVLARYNTIDLDDNGISGGTLNSFTFGVNWIWNPQARVQFNYDFTNRSAVKSTPQANIDMLGLRFSYDF